MAQSNTEEASTSSIEGWGNGVEMKKAQVSSEVRNDITSLYLRQSVCQLGHTSAEVDLS